MAGGLHDNRRTKILTEGFALARTRVFALRVLVPPTVCPQTPPDKTLAACRPTLAGEGLGGVDRQHPNSNSEASASAEQNRRLREDHRWLLLGQKNRSCWSRQGVRHDCRCNPCRCRSSISRSRLRPDSGLINLLSGLISVEKLSNTSPTRTVGAISPGQRTGPFRRTPSPSHFHASMASPC